MVITCQLRSFTLKVLSLKLIIEFFNDSEDSDEFWSLTECSLKKWRMLNEAP